MITVENLDIYKLSEELSDLIWADFDNWNKKIQVTIGYQIIRSSDSIAANISEGFGRFTQKIEQNSIYTQEAHLKKLKHG